ncbi:MAG TPA: hypothetical protein ENN56_00465 [Firmicutes bacterium]|nr:hypothetical protein [Bacillota bacterium]
MQPYMVYQFVQPSAESRFATASEAPATSIDTDSPQVLPVSTIRHTGNTENTTSESYMAADFTITYDFNETQYREDLLAAHEAFREDNEGLSWDEFVAEYFEDLRALRESRTESERKKSYEDFRRELGL